MNVRFKLNGRDVEVDVEPNELLINVLRERLGITSVKYGCGIGECGACTVLVDGEPVLSCLTLAVEVDGREVVTVEGLVGDPVYEALKKAFIEEGAIQCGYCTPGFLVVSTWLLRENPCRSIDEFRELLRGNLCRCTGYINILKAVARVSRELCMESSK